jgi:hypothetical protein
VRRERLVELLDYDPESGCFFWKVNRNQMLKGSKAGTVSRNGYIRIFIDGKHYAANKLAWFFVNGEYPRCDIDHINRVRSDNRISNLRKATRSENCQNASLRKNNKTGVTGVCWNPFHKKWQSRIMINGKSIHLGYHDTMLSAAKARSAAKKNYHSFNPEDSNEKKA